MSGPNSYLQSVLSAFAEMDIDKLQFYLKEEYNYQDTTKEIFLEKISGLFKDFREEGNSHLEIHPGLCGSDPKECDNCGKRGYLFMGNASKNYIGMVFEFKEDELTDIFDCSFFKTDSPVADLGSKASVYVHRDEDIKFNKTPEYWSKVNAAEKAYAELITDPYRMLEIEELCYWLEKNQFVYQYIGEYSVFDSPMRWTPFTELYYELENCTTYITTHQKQFREALKNSSEDLTRPKLLTWLNTYKTLHEEVPVEWSFLVKKDGEHYFNSTKTLGFTGAAFDRTQAFITRYETYYALFFGDKTQ
jgi:hypothetical protein